jgi:hypothetical protein
LRVADNDTMTFINQTDEGADAFLFGRRTYELFAGYRARRSGLAPRRKIRANRSRLP